MPSLVMLLTWAGLVAVTGPPRELLPERGAAGPHVVAPGVRIGLDQTLASVEDAVRVRYVANSGMLVEAAGRRFLIDAPIREGISPQGPRGLGFQVVLAGRTGSVVRLPR
jgi:hypothetical protein